MPQQAQQAENALSPHAAQTSTSEDGSTTADVDATAADIRSKGLMSAAAVSEEAGIASTGDPQQQDQAKAAGSDVTQTYPDTQLYQFADIELAQH